MKRNPKTPQVICTTVDSSRAVPDTVIDVDYYMRKAKRTFDTSTLSIELAAERARNDDELKQALGLAERLLALAIQMEEELQSVMKTEQQRNEMSGFLQTEVQMMYERLQQMLKAKAEEKRNHEAGQHNGLARGTAEARGDSAGSPELE